MCSQKTSKAQSQEERGAVQDPAPPPLPAAVRPNERWAMDFIRPGKPVENAYVKSFHGRFRDECLNEHYFLSLQEAQDIIEAWRAEYNGFRPHSALNHQTPEEFLKQYGKQYGKQNRNQNNPELSLQVV